MIVKIMTLFLIAMIVLAIFGKLRVPDPRRLTARKCPDCGRYRIGKSACECRRK